MQPDGINEQAVLKAIEEFDRLGRRAFLEKYGFGGAKDYFLRYNGKNYDSKAIAAVAHRYMPGGEALEHSELSGGVKHRVGAARILRGLGFNIATSGENADWTWDEHVLALDLYMKFRNSIPGKKSEQVVELSSLLIRYGEKIGAAMTEKYRNANGVYMKLMNFSALDPLKTARGKKGLPQGNKLERAVWNRYAEQPLALASAANAIRLALQDDTADLSSIPTEEHEAEEGALILRWHKSRERSSDLARKKREEVIRKTGKLACEVCEFDFSVQYGSHGLGFIEVHHKKMVSQLKPGEKTKLSDLAAVCPNCHRMLHKGKPLLSLDELRRMLRPLAVSS